MSDMIFNLLIMIWFVDQTYDLCLRTLH